MPVAGLAALATIIVHSCIAHKELRFIFPAMALLIPLAGVGLAGIWGGRTKLQKILLTAGILTGPYMSPVLYMMLPWQDNAHRLYAELAARHPCVVSIQYWGRGFWPVLPVFDGTTRFTVDTIGGGPPGAVEADAIIASADHPASWRGFTRQSCVPQSWIPFHKRPPDVCDWIRPVASCPVGPVVPFILVFPPAAKAFIIRDRLTD